MNTYPLYAGDRTGPGRWLTLKEIDYYREELAYSEHRRRCAEAKLADAQRQIGDLQWQINR